MTMPWLMNCAHSSDSWCLDCVRKEHDELTQRAEDAEQEACCLAGSLAELKDEYDRLRSAMSEPRMKLHAELSSAYAQIESIKRSIRLSAEFDQYQTVMAEVDDDLRSLLVSHESVTDLIHTLTSYQGGRYERTAHDSIAVIRWLREAVWRLRKAADKNCQRTVSELSAE